MSSIVGNILDMRTAEPIEGATLTAEGEGLSKQASSGPKGEFELDGLTRGMYEVVARKMDYDDGIWGPLFVGDEGPTEIKVALPLKAV